MAYAPKAQGTSVPLFIPGSMSMTQMFLSTDPGLLCSCLVCFQSVDQIALSHGAAFETDQTVRPGRGDLLSTSDARQIRNLSVSVWPEGLPLGACIKSAAWWRKSGGRAKQIDHVRQRERDVCEAVREDS
jgi:hypothetical protein